MHRKCRWCSKLLPFYHYDTAGRLLASSFAQTRTDTFTGWPEDPPEYYIAESRAVQTNSYDAAGRVLSVENWWADTPHRSGSEPGEYTYEGPAYTNEAPIGDGKVSYAYDSTTGLRTSQSFHNPNGSGDWATAYRTEYYDYDSSLDYLTGVDYND